MIFVTFRFSSSIFIDSFSLMESLNYQIVFLKHVRITEGNVCGRRFEEY